MAVPPDAFELPPEGEETDESNLLATKTPISLLQELATKKGLTPQYELLSTEGQVHEPTFVYRVLINEYVATGSGKSKKLAKHMAAKSVLQKLVSAEPDEWLITGVPQEDTLDFIKKLMPELQIGGVLPLGPDSSGDPVHLPVAGTLGPNPVGQLQEMCIQNKWNSPVYEIESEEGPPHERTFLVSVKMGNFEEQGEGRSKKTGKRIAAEKMIKRLKEMTHVLADGELEDGDLEGRPVDEDIAKELAAFRIGSSGGTEDGVGINGDLPGKEDGDGPQASNSASSHSVKAAQKSHLDSLLECDLDAETPSMKHVKLLRNICKEQRKLDKQGLKTEDPWGHPSFKSLQQTSTEDDFQCLVRIQADDVIECYGTSQSAEQAKHAAAREALLHIRLMYS